jgi:hypothetical protein
LTRQNAIVPIPLINVLVVVGDGKHNFRSVANGQFGITSNLAWVLRQGEKRTGQSPKKQQSLEYVGIVSHST